MGVNCRVFNVGEYRRKLVGAQLDHSFFDPHNKVAIDQRLKCAVMALSDMFCWFEDVHNGVAIYDATNSTRARRKMIYDECHKHDIEVMFCESWCDDNDLIDMNIREVKRTSPDYKGVQDIRRVMEDFHSRIDHYSEVYEPLGGDGTRPLAKRSYDLPPTNPTLDEYDERLVSYVRKINVGAKMVINRITSYLESRIIYFMMNIHIATRSVFFSRHGESIYNLDQRLGGDPSLSPNGRKYADALPGLISKLMGDQPLTIWTSTLKRTAETAAGLSYKKMQWKALDELDAGLCDGLTYEDVESQYPEEYAMRDENKFDFRYRGGESYRDVVLRLEPVIMELERQQNIMIISHQAVLRCIYAYFLDIGPEELPYLKIPLHTVMKLTWTAYGCDIQMYKIDIDAVDTHRAKPKAAKRGGTIKGRSNVSDSNVSGRTSTAASDNFAPSPPQSATTVKPELLKSAFNAAVTQDAGSSQQNPGTIAAAAADMPLPTPPPVHSSNHNHNNKSPILTYQAMPEMQHIDHDRLYTDLQYRYDYVSGFIGFTKRDQDLIKQSGSVVAGLVPTIVDAVYDKLAKYDITWGHFAQDQEGLKIKDNKSRNVADVTMKSEVITFRKTMLAKYLKKLVTAEWNLSYLKYLDWVGHIHTTTPLKKSTINVEYIHCNALFGYVAAVVVGALQKSTEWDDETRDDIVNAYNKFFWVQNDLFAKYYVKDRVLSDKEK
ncbi:Fructose-2,6-bisphosphatase, partial [Coemansia erecta]